MRLSGIGEAIRGVAERVAAQVAEAAKTAAFSQKMNGHPTVRNVSYRADGGGGGGGSGNPAVTQMQQGWSIDQIAKAQGISRDDVIRQLQSDGYDVSVSEHSDVRVTNVRDTTTGQVVTENYDYQHGSYYVDVKDPDGGATSSPIRDEAGRKVTTTVDDKGVVTTRYDDDLGTGTVTETKTLPDGTSVKTVTNRDGSSTQTKRFKDGSEVTTARNADGSVTETTTRADHTVVTKTTRDGKTTTTVTSPDGKTTTTLASDQNVSRQGVQPIVEDLANGKSIDQIAADHGWTRAQVIAQLQAAGLTVREYSHLDGDVGTTEVVENGKVIARNHHDYRHGTEQVHYTDSHGNDVTRTRGADGTTTQTVTEGNGRETKTTTTADGKKTTAVTFNGYTLTTAPDGSRTLHDNETGTDLKLKKGSVEEALALQFMSVDPNSGSAEDKKKAQVLTTFIEGILAGQTLPQLIEAAEKAGVTKDELIAKYPLGPACSPVLDGQNRIIDPFGKPPPGNAPSGAKWVPVMIGGTWYWADPQVAKAVNDESIAIARATEAQTKARQAHDQLDVYALDPAYKGAMAAARKDINKTLAPFELQWITPKPKGTLEEARARLAQTNTELSQISGARQEYEKAGNLLTTAIDQWNALKVIPDLTKPAVGTADNGTQRQLNKAQIEADHARVKGLLTDVGVHMSQGDKLTVDYRITASGATDKAPAGTFAEGEQPVEITVGGQTMKVTPAAKKAYEAEGINGLLEAGKPVAIEVEVTNADGTKSKQWRWLDPKLAVEKIGVDRQIGLVDAYSDFFKADARSTDLQIQQLDLQQQLLGEYNAKKKYGVDPEATYTSFNGKYYGKFVSQEVVVRGGQLYVINHFEKGTQEEQLTYPLDTRKVHDDYRDRPLNKQWQELMNGDASTCGTGGLEAARRAEDQAGADLNSFMSGQYSTDIKELETVLPGLRNTYAQNLAKYGAGTVDAPAGTIPAGAQPVEITVGGTKIKVAPEVAAQIQQDGIEVLDKEGAAVWIEIDITGSDGQTRHEGRWVDPRVAYAKIQADGAQAQVDGKKDLLSWSSRFGEFYSLKLSKPELAADTEGKADDTYLKTDEKAALDSIYQPQFMSFYDNGYDNAYRQYTDGQLKGLIADKLGYDLDTEEGEKAVNLVFDEVRDEGGSGAKVSLVPIVNVDATGSMPTTLFAVQDGDGHIHYVDATGRSFDNLKELQDNNSMFAEGTKLVVPVDLQMTPGADGTIPLQVVDARHVSTWDRVVDPIVGIGTGVATVLSFTPAAPVAAPLAMAGGGYFAVRAGYKEVRYLQTGGEWTDTESLVNVAMFATSALPMGASGLRWAGMTRNLNIGGKQAFLASIGAVRQGGAVNAASYELAGTRFWRGVFPHAEQVGTYLGSAGGLNKAAYVLDAGAMGTGAPLMAYSGMNIVANGDEMSGLQMLDAVTGLATGFAGTMAGGRNMLMYAKGQRTETMRLRDTDGQRVNAFVLGEPPATQGNIYVPARGAKLRGDSPGLQDYTHIVVRDPETGEAFVLPWQRGGSSDHVPGGTDVPGGADVTPVSLVDRSVDLVPFDATDAGVLTLLDAQLRASPDYVNLGADGMARKWAEEIADGRRMAFVVYPAAGSRLPREPLGIVALHKEPLTTQEGYIAPLSDEVYMAGQDRDNFNLMRDGEYPKKFDKTELSRELSEDPSFVPERRLRSAGQTSRDDLLARGDVWLFSTYLLPDRTGRSSPFAGGVVNKAAKMKTMLLAGQAAADRGEPIPSFYARVHGGGAYPVGADGVQVVIPRPVQRIGDNGETITTSGEPYLIPADGEGFTRIADGDLDGEAQYLKNPKAIKLNSESLGGQQSQTGKGPIAYFLEAGSPYSGQERRNVAVFETTPGHFLRIDDDGTVILDGPGAKKWLGDLNKGLGTDGENKWSAPEGVRTIQLGDESGRPITVRVVSDEQPSSADSIYVPGSKDALAADPSGKTHVLVRHSETGQPFVTSLTHGGETPRLTIVHNPLTGSGPYSRLPGRVEPTGYSSGKDLETTPSFAADGFKVDKDGKPVINADGSLVPLTWDKIYARYQRERSYYSRQDWTARYGPDGLQPSVKRPDLRIGLTLRQRLNMGGGFGFGSIPVGSPTLNSRSVGIGTKSDFAAIARGAQLSLEQKSAQPLARTLETELSLANRPDEWRQMTAAQLGVLPGSNWTIMPVFGHKLIGLADKAFFGEADPGWAVNVQGARLYGVTPRRVFAVDGSGQTRLEWVDGTSGPRAVMEPGSSGHVIEIDFNLKVVADEIKLTGGEMDFFGMTGDQAPNGHRVLRSSIPSDRVMQDIRIAPYLPFVTHLLNAWLHTKGVPTLDVGGETLTFTPGGERRAQVLLNDSLGKGDVVPTEFVEQFNAASSGSTLRLQAVVRPLKDSGEAAPLEAFLQNPTVEGFRELVKAGYIQRNPDTPSAFREPDAGPDQTVAQIRVDRWTSTQAGKANTEPSGSMFFVPPSGHTFHQTAIPGKAMTKTITDLTGRTYQVPDEATSNLWVIFNDRWAVAGMRFSPEKWAASGVYKLKQKVRDMLPGEGPSRTASPHQLPVDGNILDGFFLPDRQLANPSYRFTTLFGLPYLRMGPMAYNAEIRFQYGREAPAVAPAVGSGDMLKYRLATGPSDQVLVPEWFMASIYQVKHGATPVIPKGGTAQINAFLDKLAVVDPSQAGPVAEFRRTYMSGTEPAIGDLRFLRRGNIDGMLGLLPGLDPDAGPTGTAEIGGGEGPKSLSAAYHAAPPPEGEASLAALPAWATTQSSAFRPYDTVAMHRSVATWDLAGFEAKLIARGVTPETAQRLVTQLGEGIESRTVQLEPFNARLAETLFPLLGKGIQYSPEYQALGPDGMAQKWLNEMAEGTRYAYVLYPAAGSPLPKEPIGMIAFHKAPLLDEHYVSTVDPSEYQGRKTAGAMTRAEIDALGPVWQSSTYLVQSPKDAPYSPASNNPYPKGVVNRASRMAAFMAIAQSEARGGERIDGFYARVHAGPNNVNRASLGSQESQTGEGPVAVVLEDTSPTPGETSRYVAIFRTPAERYLRMDAGAQPAIDGPGGHSWRSRILEGIKGDGTPEAQTKAEDWLGSELALTDFTPASIRGPGGSEWRPTGGGDGPPPSDPTTLPQRRRGYPFPEVGKRVDPEFSAKLVNHILSQGGIPFADYMNLALYGIDGQGGYYNSGLVSIGEPGAADFTTAPATSRYFGRTIADALVHMHDTMGRPARFDVVEMGAGNGVLARDILDKLQVEHPDLYQAVHYVIVERSEALVARQRTTLAEHPRVAWVHAGADALPLKNLRGVLLSNELVDAFPVHRAVVRGGELKEIFVTVDKQGGLVETERDPSPELTAVLPEYLDLFPLSERREGEHMTINARSVHWMRRAAAALDEGYVLTIDYGDIAATVSAPPYVSYRGQNMSVDYSYRYPGAIDITSHVDFAVLSEVGSRAALTQADSLGAKWLYTQQEFLTRYGLPDALRSETDAGELERGTRLLHRFGEGFYVLLQEKRPAVVAKPEPMSAEDALAARHDRLKAFVDGNLSYPAEMRDKIPVITVGLNDQGRFRASGQPMTPHQFLLSEGTSERWYGRWEMLGFPDFPGPLALDIVNPTADAIALAQRLCNLGGGEIITPRPGAPGEWQLLRPQLVSEHPQGSVALGADNWLLLDRGGDSTRIRAEDHLGQATGAGASKTAFRLYDKTVVIARDDGTPSSQIEEGMAEQMFAAHQLIDRGAPYVAPIHGMTTIYGNDAFVMDSYMGHSGSLEKVYAMSDDVTFYSFADVSLLNENSLTSLRAMKDFYVRENIGVDDTQFLIAADGTFYLHDFSKVYDFNDFDPYAVMDDPELPTSNRGFIAEIDRWISFVGAVVDRRGTA